MKYFYALMLFIISQNAPGITTVRLSIGYNNMPQDVNVDIDLYDNLTPLTTTNFLNYVINDDYKNSLIHQATLGVFLAGGKYTFDPTAGPFEYDINTDTYSGGLQPVPPGSPINSEFRFSNTRGTIAMTIKNGDINSATNDWIINLGNNINQFDYQSFGTKVGLTVFGKVRDSDLTKLDNIASLPRINLAGYQKDFNPFPVVNYQVSANTPGDIALDNVVRINTIKKIYSVTSFTDFGSVTQGNQVTKDININNYNLGTLDIGTITNADPSGPFQILSDNCSNQSLTMGASCLIQVTFTMPATGNYFNDSLSIPLLSEGRTISSYLTNTSPNIDVTQNTIDFGAVPVYTASYGLPKSIYPLVYNRGFTDLNIASITLSGANKDEFELNDNCTTSLNIYQPGKVPPTGFCSFGIVFKPKSLDVKHAEVTIVSDDPDSGTIVIPITGGVSTDNDGVDNAIEDAAPNSGDNNNDGIPDSLQNNVTSFPDSGGVYTSVITDSNSLFTNVKSVPLSTLDPLPQGVSLGDGALSFELSGFSAGSTVQFGLILPSGNSPTNIYSYGPTSDNATPHWYTLQKNTSPGAAIIGNASISDPSGNSISRNLTQIQIQDGGYGDSDMQANGKISFTGGPEITNTTSNGSGSALWVLFIAPVTIIVLRKKSRPSQ